MSDRPVPRMYVFADEAGCLTFRRGPNISRYFVLCTVVMADCRVGAALLDLRRDLAWAGAPVGDYFHASNDQQIVRDAVFASILRHDFSIRYTLMEKSKALPHITADRRTFYKYGWHYHFKYGVSRLLPSGTETLVTAAAIGTRKERAAFSGAVDDVMKQLMPVGRWKTDFPPAHADPCVQVADYCAWAIQRYFERGDARSYDLIRSRIGYGYDLWSRGTTHHY